MHVPRAHLIAGLAGLLPLLWGAITVLSPDLGMWSARALGPQYSGLYVMLFYGAVILYFMSGVHWGFAARLKGARAASGYALAVLPAFWAFFMLGSGPDSAAISLMAGIVGLLGLDWLFWRYGVAPEWWMRLRVLLTLIALICLSIGVFA